MCVRVEGIALEVLHAVPDVFTSSRKHSAHADQWPQDGRCDTHQAHEWDHLVQRLDPVVLVLAFIQKAKSLAVEQFANDVKRIPVRL